MLTRSLIGVTLLSLLAVPGRAKTIGSCAWPPVYELPDKCAIPVMMDVGMYVEILDCCSLSIKLKQVASETYEGCTEIRIRSNFDVELGCEIESTGRVPGDYSCFIDDPKVPMTLSENVAVRDVCVKVEKVRIAYAQPGCNIHVANVTITVKPDC